MGHDVCIITSDRYAPFPDFSRTVGNVLGKRYVGSGIFEEEGLKVIRLRCLFEYASIAVVWSLGNALTYFSPDIVHAHGEASFLSVLSVLYKHSLHYKVIIDSHVALLQTRSILRRALFHILSKNLIYRYLLRKADGYIAVSESSRECLSREWGINYDRIRMIPLGADKFLFSPNITKRKSLRSKLGIDDNEVVVIYAGKIIPSKDIDVLLLALVPLIHRYKNVKVLLVGSGNEEYLSRLRQIANKCKIGDSVLFHSFVDKTILPDFYNVADVGVWPGAPSITILEAMAAGLPIVIPRYDVTNTENLHHYLEYGNGFDFERGNMNELTGSLEKLVTSKNLRHEMGSKSRKLIVERLGWDTIAKETSSFYSEILPM